MRTRVRLLFLISVLLSFLLPEKTYALEVYTLIKDGCKTETGLIVNADDDYVHMLTLEGKLALLKRKEIELVLVYNIHDNPIASLDLGSGLKDSLREVEVDDNENTHFIGWPIRFIEKLIMFYDIDGKTHLVDIDRIKSFSYPKNVDFAAKKIATFESSDFGLGDNLPECTAKEAPKEKETDPTRMISDRIQLHKFFSVYHAGFAHLKRFQKKTAFYAKPFLYDKETRLGLTYTEEDYLHELHAQPFLYFQWSSGSPYGSQGQYVLGSKTVDLLPLVEPQTIFRADAKSHLFTGTFVGNLFGLSGGSDYIIENRMLYTGFFSKIDDDAHMVYPQFNYMALTGVDFHEYSFSAGFYYPLYGIYGNKIFREISSNDSSPVLRFQKTTKEMSLKVIYSQSRIKSDSPGSDGINLIKTNELKEYSMKSDVSGHLIDSLERYDLKARFVRVNLDYDVTREMNIGFSQVLFQGEYKERFAGEGYGLDFLHLVSSLSLNQSFSEYTAIKADINYFSRKNDYKSEDETGEYNEDKISFAISIEFFL